MMLPRPNFSRFSRRTPGVMELRSECSCDFGKISGRFERPASIDQSSRRVPIFRRSRLPPADPGELGLPRRNLSCRTIWTRRSLDRTSGWTSRISTFFAAKSVRCWFNVCHSIAGAVPSPGFHPEGMYEFKVDLDGDAVEEIAYRIRRARRSWKAADEPPSDQLHTRDGSPCAGYVGGGMVKSHRACGSLTPHGYHGIEAQVIDIIARWLDAHR